jgi:ankyrin repeat protein
MSEELTAVDGHAETELHAIAWAGDVERAQELINSGIDVNLTDSIQESPLHGAAAWGRTEMVQLLLNNGADPNLKNNDGSTPLHWACSHGNEKVVELLINSGATLQSGGSGQSPLEIAKAHNKQGIISWLKQNT